MDIKEIVGADKKVKFAYFKDNELWYVAENGFEFPVPIEDTAGAVFKDEDKSLFFMRWIRKHIKYLEDSKKEQGV